MSPSDFDFLTVVISRNEVESGDTSGPIATLKGLLQSPGRIQAFQTRVNVAFFGYDDSPEELFEIPAVRNYVSELDAAFPYWLYFMARKFTGLQCLALCMLPPFLTEEARTEIHRQRLADLMDRRWVPALRHLCSATGESDAEAGALVESALRYFMDGPTPLPPQ
ncbi:MAG: hypothetical protein AB7N65_11205 [Vicinamibacterales bacterium]